MDMSGRGWLGQQKMPSATLHDPAATAGPPGKFKPKMKGKRKKVAPRTKKLAAKLKF